MKKIYILVFCLLFIQSAFAQHTISGIVSDAKDKTLLIEGVEVFIPEFNRLENSKEGGTYILRNIGIGIVHLQFTKRGYKSIVKTINTVDSATVVNVDMEPFEIRYSEVTAFSNYTKEPSFTPYNISVITSDEFRRSGCINLSSTLANEPGINKSSAGNISVPVIRGLPSDHLLLIQSGTRIENRTWNPLIDFKGYEEGAEAIEIIKGPATLMYGDGAMAGVIIVSDEKMPPAGTIQGELNTAYFTNTAGINTDLGLKGASEKGVFWSGRLGGKSHTSYIQGQGTEVEKNTEVKKYAYNSGFLNFNSKGVLGVNKKWGKSKLTISFYDRENEVVKSLSDSAIELIIDPVERERKSYESFVTGTQFLSSWENLIFLKKNQLNLNVSYTSVKSNYVSDLNSFNYDFKYSSNAEKKLGYIFGLQGYLQQTGKNLLSLDNDLTSHGLFAMVRYDNEKINVLAGARFDRKQLTSSVSAYNTDYNLPSGSAGIAWHPHSTITIKLNAATGNYIPIEQRLNFLTTIPGLYNNNVNLVEEKNYEGDFGVEWRNRNVTIGLSGFYNRVNNFIFPVLEDSNAGIDSSQNLYSYVQHDVDFNGGEAYVTLHPVGAKWLEVSGSYSAVQSDLISLDDNNKIVTGIRFQSEKMNSLYKPFISIVARTYSNVPNFSTISEGYTLYELHIGGSIRWGEQMFDFTISATNILDKDYFSSLSYLERLEPVPVMDMGRNISLQLRFPFGITPAK